MKSLVTGIGGFVGPHLARHLLLNGHDVSGIERSPKAVRGCRIFSCDILDKPKVDDAVKKSRPDFVFHLAAMSSVSESYKDPQLTARVNIEGTKNLLESVMEYSPNASVLVVSTAHVYGIPKVFPIPETHELNPISPYAKTRVDQEKVALDFFRNRGLKVVISRSFNHTGPGQPRGFICSDFAKQIVDIENGAEPVMKVGSLSSKRDFTDVRDVVKAYLYAVKECAPGNIYNICSGNAYSSGEILELLLEMTDRKIEVIEDKTPRKGDIHVLVGDNSKFVKATGWHPTIPFKKTLKDILDYWRKLA